MAFIIPAIPYIIAAAAAVSAVSAVRQAQAQSQQYQQQADVAQVAGNFNATVNDQNAEIVRQDAKDQALQSDRETYLRLGAIRAAQGHSGGSSGQGSVLDILGDAAAQSELEKQNILYQGELKARGFQNTSMLDRYGGATSSSRLSAAADNTMSAGYLKAGTELLSGTANAYTANAKLART